MEKEGRTLISQKGTLQWNGGRVDFYRQPAEMRQGQWVFVAADETTKTLAFKPDEALILGLEDYRGEKALKALVVLPENCSDAYFSVAGEQQVLTRRLKFSDRTGVVIFDEAPKLMSAMQAAVFDFKNDETVAKANVSVADVRTQIALEISPGSKKQRPGESARADIVAKDSTGKPVSVELTLAAADNALVELRGARYSQTHAPVFSLFKNSVHINWHASDSGRERHTVSRSADPRDGALILAMFGGGKMNGELIWDKNPGIIQVDSFTQQMTPPPPSESDRVGNSMGAAFDLRDLDDGRVCKDGTDGIRLRRHFAWTAFWEPELLTDKDGRASVNFTYPDNLTQWRIAAYAVGEDGNTFGTAQVMTRTSLPLQARAQAPRFLIEGDEAALSGLFVNRTDADLRVSANMKATGAVDLVSAQRDVFVPRQAETRASWQAKARGPGEAVISLTAKAGAESDGMAQEIPVLEDGIRQDMAACARLAAGEGRASMTLALPNPLNHERLAAEVIVAQGRADVMINALPYLIDYPYGCVEQTMSRFLPAVVVKKTLCDFGFDAGAVEKRILAPESDAAKARRERSAGLQKLDDVVAKSLGSLREARHYREGFGWWPNSRSSDLWMTAYVAWGLQLASEAGVTVDERWLDDVRKVLAKMIQRHENVDDRLAWALFVMAEVPTFKIAMKDFGALKKTYARVYAARENLSASGRACLLAASARWGADAERAVLLRNLKNGMQRTAHGVHWGATNGYWRATEGAVESTAQTAIALMKTDPGNALLEPALDWLVMNRRGNGWQNTRASSFAVLALARAAARSGDEAFEGGVDVFLNGKKLKSVMFSKKALLAGATRVALPAALLRSGDNRIELKRSAAGKGDVYATALASAWARGDSVKPEANLVSVARDFSGRRIEPTLGGDGKLRATAMAETGIAQTGDEVTARVALSVPDSLEYMMVAVPKPAGCEPLNPLNGWDAELIQVSATNDSTPPVSRRIYREEHDDHSAFFLDHVEAGEWEIRFAMRAVTPGDFRALPVKVEAMYVPEIRANSDARRVRIEAR
ncbi:alpha-2-macroglobulin family protein [Ereboglobus luteus]|uniref:alpha-2-macroglobulin family protein n=1 Tax=Ereboglobus luteus TaxID=1796921 RepID=UPI001374E52A|nr:alpha-2-macroglobulin family protein [Ereboglobus luteus]